MSIVLFVFTLNEIDGFKKIMPHVKREWVDDIIVVDGGSTDGTIEEAERQSFKIPTEQLASSAISKRSHNDNCKYE